MKVVEDREIDQGLGTEVEAEIGLGAEVQEVELQVHSEDGVRVAKPSGEVPAVGRDVELEDEGWAGTKVGQLNITGGNSDRYGLNKLTDGASVGVDRAGRVEDGLFGEESAGWGESGDAIGFDVQANGAGIGVAGCRGQWGLAHSHGRWR